EVLPFAPAYRLFRRRLGVAVELPKWLAGLRLEAVQPAVAAGEDHLALAVDLGVRRVRPLSFQDLVPRRSVLPDHLATVLVNGEEARRLRVDHLAALLRDAVAGDHVHQVADDQRRAGRHLAGEDAQLLDHVELPDRLAGFDVGADHLAAVADIVNPIPL